MNVHNAHAEERVKTYLLIAGLGSVSKYEVTKCQVRKNGVQETVKMSVGSVKNNKLMEFNSYKTASVNKATAKKEWVVVDAEGQILGRMASKVAKLLRGKYKPSYTPNVDCGDNVIIVNADKVQLTGNKWNGRVYVRYTGFPGGQREFTPADLLAKGADKLVRRVVKGMLPKNRLGARQINNLYIFAGAEHNMQAQQPKQIDINTLK